MVDSNDKGARGEHGAINLIRPWWAMLEPGVDFTRTPKSGGWGKAAHYDMAGDLMTDSKFFPFCVEVKFREAWNLENVLAGKASPVWSWWRQACRDALKTQDPRVPMLWWRKRHVPWRVLIPRAYANERRLLMPDAVEFPAIGWRHLPVRPVMYMADRFLLHDPSVFGQLRRAS